jgi:hypothetical protein
MKTNVSTGLLIGLSLFTAPAAFAQATITVNAAKPGHAIPATLWGIFLRTSTCPPMAGSIPNWCGTARLKMPVGQLIGA